MSIYFCPVQNTQCPSDPNSKKSKSTQTTWLKVHNTEYIHHLHHLRVTPKTNKHTHTEKLRCLQGNIWSKEEQGGGGEGRSCHLYQVLLESSRFILKPFDLRGLRSDIFKVFFLKWHCTAHIAHSVTKCGDQKCIEEQSSSISSNAQCQSWRLESSNLKGEISFHGRVIVTAHNSSLFCGVV